MARCWSAKRWVRSASVGDTERCGEQLGRRLGPGIVVCLTGVLGSGKSVLARGICKGLGVGETVTSPTFILCQEYAGRIPVVHCDLYRLEHERDIDALGLFDRLGGDEAVLVEWGDRSPRIYARADIVMHVEITGPSERRIDIRGDEAAREAVEGMVA